MGKTNGNFYGLVTILNICYLRSTVDKAEQHEELVVLAEGGRDDGECVDDGDGDEHPLAAQGVRH